jgi:hypothetical protein
MGLINKDGDSNTLSVNEMWAIRDSYSKEEVDRPGQYSPMNRKYFDRVLTNVTAEKDAEFKNLIENLEMEARRAFRKTMDVIRDVDVKITCFSNFKNDYELAQNTTMWSHYANNHTGFCVKYSLKKVDDFVKTGLLPVKYTSNVPKLSVPNVLKSLDGNQKWVANPRLAEASRKALITKSALWSYEREWRLMVETERVDLLINNCIDFPYAEAIYMGCRMENNLKYHLASYAEKNGLKIFETWPNEERFVLDISETSLERLKESAWYDELFRSRTDLANSDEMKVQRDRIWRKLDNLRRHS